MKNENTTNKDSTLKPLKEMINTQLTSWDLILRKKGLKDSTIERKLKNIYGFYDYLEKARSLGKVNKDNITNLAFEFVKEGYFSEDNIENEGTYGYRRNIYYNIMEGFNYIYEGYFKDIDKVIKDLTDEEKSLLEELSKNKYFKVTTTKEGAEYYSIQAKIIENLGLKVYFDENNKPYVLSHETAELLGKNNKDMLRDLRNLMSKFEKFTRAQNCAFAKSLDISMVEDTYTYQTNNGGSKEATTYRLSKDLILNYVLGLTGEKFSIFRFEYQAAFNYIEEQFNKQLQENARLKEEFINMYNQIRKRNRDLLIGENNKQCKNTRKNKKGLN